MPRYTDALAQSKWFIKCMLGVVAAATTIAVLALMGWRNAQRDVTVHIPPDLTGGAQIRVGKNEVPQSTVYLFGFYIWQQLNRWSKNGQTDYGGRIYALQAFLTPACLEQLVNDQAVRAKQGELDQRTRSIMEIPGVGYSANRVVAQSDGSWDVKIDTQVLETSRGIPVKDAYIRYPLHIVRYDVDRELNPWQLAIDCYTPETQPERLDPKAVAVASNGTIIENNAEYAKKYSGDLGASNAAPYGEKQAQSPPATLGEANPLQPSTPKALAPATLPRVAQ